MPCHFGFPLVTLQSGPCLLPPNLLLTPPDSWHPEALTQVPSAPWNICPPSDLIWHLCEGHISRLDSEVFGDTSVLLSVP